jgi:hypothetical protein
MSSPYPISPKRKGRRMNKSRSVRISVVLIAVFVLTVTVLKAQQPPNDYRVAASQSYRAADESHHGTASFETLWNQGAAGATPPPQYAQAPQQYAQAPQQYAQAPQQYAQTPQQYAQPPQQYAQHQHQQYAQPPQQYASPPQQYVQPTQFTAQNSQPIDFSQQASPSIQNPQPGGYASPVQGGVSYQQPALRQLPPIAPHGDQVSFVAQGEGQLEPMPLTPPDRLLSDPGQPPELATDLGSPHTDMTGEIFSSDCFVQFKSQLAQSWWLFDIDMIGLRRQEANNYPLLVDPTECCPVIDPGDFNYDFELGVRARAARMLNCQWSGEITYMGIPSWSGKRGAAGNLDLRGPGWNLGVNPGVFEAKWKSSFHSLEASLTRGSGYCVGSCGGTCSPSACGITENCGSTGCGGCSDCTGGAAGCMQGMGFAGCGQWPWFVGLRYMRLDDSLLVCEYNAPFFGALDVEAYNNLYGLQIGTDLPIYNRGGPFSANFRLKFGAYVNDAHQNISSSFLGPPIESSSLKAAFATEAEIELGYRLTDRIQFHGGYMLLSMAGVALAPDQIHATDMSTGYAPVELTDLLLDGAYVGLRVRW